MKSVTNESEVSILRLSKWPGSDGRRLWLWGCRRGRCLHLGSKLGRHADLHAAPRAWSISSRTIREASCRSPLARVRPAASRQARAAVHEAQGETREQARRIQEQGAVLEALRGQVADTAAAGARLSGALAQARQEAATATLRADAAERQAQRTAEALAASQAALAAAETASVALRLEVATLTERAAQSADLRAVIATLQEPTPGPAPKKPPVRRRGQTSQGAT